jgi:hypothetical protein
MFFLVQTIVGLTQTLFSEAEPIFYASEICFSITEKTVGEAPTAFMQPQPIIASVLRTGS